MGGLDVGVLAFTDNVPEWSVERRTPGVAYAEIDPDGAGIQRLQQEVQALSREVDVTVVSAHWGPNMRRTTPSAFRSVARGFVDAGADVVWGHSAHLFQAVEAYDGGLILYDTGDFLDDYRIDSEERNDVSFLYRVHLAHGRVRRVDLDPIQIDTRNHQVDPANANAASFARGRLREVCVPFDTALEQRPDGGMTVPVHPDAEDHGAAVDA